ncbi:MAG TPA: hypothetical protein VFF15_09705 [Flavobacteriaceae bacterium]|nr:hypothetical protein [Flavobacteriaceae bacterium]
MFRFLVFFLLCTGAYAQECEVTIDNASAFVGKEVTVCGVVTEINSPEHISGSPTYFNMGGLYPNQIFTLVLWGKNKHKFVQGLDHYKGKHLTITGVVELFRGKPQMVLTFPEQVKELPLGH